MVKIHNLGFPRMGEGRELKFALERYFRGELSQQGLEQVALELRQRNWQHQQQLDFVPVGDASLYDHVLDTTFLVGNVPARMRTGDSWLDTYFLAARGRSPGQAGGVAASEMTKWFDTNYHYIVPEFGQESRFSLDAGRLLQQLEQAQALGYQVKPVVLGPVSYLSLGKTTTGRSALELLPELLAVYRELFSELGRREVEWIQVDEPVLVMDLPSGGAEAFRRAYRELTVCGPKVLLTTYFGELSDNIELLAALPVHGVHVDAVRGGDELPRLLNLLSKNQVLSLGVVDGRNVWRTDLAALLDRLEPIAQEWSDRLWLAPSCSLLHVPVDLELEHALDPELKDWMAFAVQKLEELVVLRSGLTEGRSAVAKQLLECRRALEGRRASPRVHKRDLGGSSAGEQDDRRSSSFPERRARQRQRLKLPLLPTTTIGSFPQTTEIRRLRRSFRGGAIPEEEYRTLMRREIASVVREQEAVGLDVLVHGEPERTDMVEYFGEMLEGFAISEFGWVQSYGSRCVKPPILFGDVKRTQPITVPWIKYAQALTPKPMKGMLTGPVTILNWSFVRDDQPRSASCEQIARAIRQEVSDLESAGIGIIQIDEAALREGLPLRRRNWGEYLSWAVRCFRISSSSVRDETQIHTHMCYSEFNDIIQAIAELDADVITIENSRSHGELLRAFDDFDYEREIGPGVYDIHSPNVPTREEISKLVRAAADKIPMERLWINPDCGLKTRSWEEVRPALQNMVAAAKALREEVMRSASEHHPPLVQ